MFLLFVISIKHKYYIAQNTHIQRYCIKDILNWCSSFRFSFHFSLFHCIHSQWQCKKKCFLFYANFMLTSFHVWHFAIQRAPQFLLTVPFYPFCLFIEIISVKQNLTKLKQSEWTAKWKKKDEKFRWKMTFDFRFVWKWQLRRMWCILFFFFCFAFHYCDGCCRFTDIESDVILSEKIKTRWRKKEDRTKNDTKYHATTVAMWSK